MKKLSLGIVVIFLGSFLAAQNVIRFSKVYDVVPGIHDCLSSSILLPTSGYIIYGETKDSANSGKISLIKIDSTGKLIWSKSYGKKGMQYYSTYSEGAGGVVVPWGGYAGTGWITNDSATWSDAALFRFDGKGDTVWTRKYNDSAQIECTKLKVTRDKKYIIGGFWIGASNYYTVTLMKTDSLGNKVWQRNYPTGYSCIIGGLDTCPDGGFILTLDMDYVGCANKTSYIIKTDSLGKVQWTQTIFDPICSVAGVGVISLSNGEYAVCGGYDTSSSYPYYTSIYVSKRTSSGNTKWAKQYSFNPSPFGSSSFMLRELPNGNLIVSGSGADTNSNFWGLIMRVDSNGNKIWLRSYNMQQPSEQDYLNDIRPTPDGGFVASGFTYGSLANIWVVKTDSSGCADTAGCVFTAVNELPTDNIGVKVFPNPSNGRFTIELSTQNAKNTIDIYNMLGEKVYTSPLVSMSNQIDLSDKPKGIYLYRLINENGELVSSGKFIIQ